MTWSDVTRPPKPKVVRQFGLLCFLIFAVVGLLQVYLKGRPTLGWSLVAAGVVSLVLSQAAPNLFRWVFTGAMLAAFPIGFAVSQVMLALLFFGLFLGLGLLLRARGWDPMLLRRKPSGTSYWEPKPTPADSSRYLRQY